MLYPEGRDTIMTHVHETLTYNETVRVITGEL